MVFQNERTNNLLIIIASVERHFIKRFELRYLNAFCKGRFLIF